MCRRGYSLFSLRKQESIDDHHFAIYDCGTSDDDDFVQLLVDLVVDLYVGRHDLAESLRGALSGLDDLFDLSHVEASISAIVDVSIPEPGSSRGGSQPWLDVARNELAEIIAYVAAEEIYRTVLPVKRIREKEVANLPTRGMDLLAVERSPVLRLFVGEVKASEQDKSPPDVVEGGSSSLRSQLIGAINDHRRILAELSYTLKHTADSFRDLVAECILRWVAHGLPIVAFPILVRSESTLGPDDFGSFRKSHQDYAPATIRFCLPVLAVSIDELASEVYTRARAS